MMAAKTISLLRQKFPFIRPEVTVDHLVVGGGVVGLAICRELVNRFKRKSTFLVERNPLPGQETSSRNSEVIHAGIYYPQDSLKTGLCLRGRKLLYEYCRTHKIAHRKIGKLIISQSSLETEYLKRLYDKCQAINQDKKLRRAVLFGQSEDREEDLAPLKILNGEESLRLEPNLTDKISFSLYSPQTGVLDSHSFLSSLENSIDQSDNGEIVYATSVVRIDRSPANDGWVVQTLTGPAEGSKSDGERNSILTKCLINCAGLNAHNIYNQVLYPKALQLGFCKGSYCSYTSRKGVESVKHLIYPTPVQRPNQTSFVGLGTHLTIDMNQKIKFGPDIEWLTPEMTPINFPDSSGSVGVEREEVQDFWTNHLNPNEQRLEMTYRSVKDYLPGVVKEGFSVDYSGIRPKLLTPNQVQNQKNFEILKRLETDEASKLLNDFYIRQTEPGMINLLGIESPGLTSSLAIAEYVRDLIQTDFWGLKAQDLGDERFSNVGRLDDWA